MSREAILARERAWAGRAALAGFLAAALLIAGVFVHLQIPQESNASDQLKAFSDHSSALRMSGILTAAGLVVAAPALIYLLMAAAARSQRVRQGLAVLCVIGPLLFGAQTIIAGKALSDAGDNFVAQQDSVQKHRFSEFQNAITSDPESLDKVTIYNKDNVTDNDAEIQLTNGDFYSVTFPAKDEADLKASLDKAEVDTSEDDTGKVGDAFANHLAVDSDPYKLAGNLALPAGLTMIFAVVYPALQAFRVGLITRLLSTMGAISAATLIILPLAPALVGLWVAWLGLTFLNRLRRERAPAWDAGVAIPWPRPGDPVPDTPATSDLEGTARELDPDAPRPNPPRQRGERRKRKSRE